VLIGDGRGIQQRARGRGGAVEHDEDMVDVVVHGLAGFDPRNARMVAGQNRGPGRRVSEVSWIVTLRRTGEAVTEAPGLAVVDPRALGERGDRGLGDLGVGEAEVLQALDGREAGVVEAAASARKRRRTVGSLISTACASISASSAAVLA